MVNQLRLQALLREHLVSARAKNSAFSIRSLARYLGISSAALSEIMRGKRNVSTKMAQKIVAKLGVDPEAAHEVFGAPRGFLASLDKAHPGFAELSADQFYMVSEWQHFVILSLVETDSFESSDEWIAKRLNISLQTAASSLERLVRLGLIKRKANGSYAPSGKSYATTDGVPDAAIRQAHIKELEMARESIEGCSHELRDAVSMTMAIDPEKLPMARKMVREFREKLCAYLEAGPKTEVYKMTFNLFPLSKPVEEKSKKLATLLIALFALLAAPLAIAGHAINNGGGVVVCKRPRATTVQLLDLWEAVSIHGWHINYSSEPVLVQVEKTLVKLQNNPNVQQYILRNAKELWDAINNDPKTFLPPHASIKPPQDAEDGFGSDKNCTLQSVAVYDDSLNQLRVDHFYYDRLKNTDIAALLVHEATYRLYRKWLDVETSIAARRVTGCLFASEATCPASELDPLAVGETTDADSRWHCMSEHLLGNSPVDPSQIGEPKPLFEMYVLKKSIGAATLQMVEWHGQKLVGRTTTDISGAIDFGLGKPKQNYLGEAMFQLQVDRTLHHTTLPLFTKYGQDLVLIFRSQDSDLLINDHPVICAATE